MNQVKTLVSNERFHYVEPQHGRYFLENLCAFLQKRPKRLTLLNFAL